MSILRFLNNNFRWIVGGLLLTFFSSFGQTFFISLSAGDIRDEYGLSHGQFGLVYMLATLASAATLPWLGKIVDRYTPMQVAFLIVPCLALGCLAMAFSTHLLALVLVIYLLRLFGQGMMTQNALTATGRWFAANRGRAVSFVTLGHNVGEAVLPAVFVVVSLAIGWRNSWIAAAIVLIVFALPLISILVSKDRVKQASDPEPKVIAAREWTRPEVVRDPTFWLLLTGIMAPAFIGTTIFFHQVYLVELRGWSLTVFASAFSLMAVSTIVFTLIAGYLVDRFSAVRLLPFFLLPLGCACVVLGSFDQQWSAFAFMVLLGISYGVSSTLFGSLWPEIYGITHLGSIRAVVVSIMVFMTAAGPGVTGTLIDMGVAYPLQIITMGIYCFVAVIVMRHASTQLIARQSGIS